jgi:hypothetical protein
MAKAIRNLSGFNKKNLVFLIRNISSTELHSALGKISVVNLMYNLLGLKNCFGLKNDLKRVVYVFLREERGEEREWEEWEGGGRTKKKGTHVSSSKPTRGPIQVYKQRHCHV